QAQKTTRDGEARLATAKRRASKCRSRAGSRHARLPRPRQESGRPQPPRSRIVHSGSKRVVAASRRAGNGSGTRPRRRSGWCASSVCPVEWLRRRRFAVLGWAGGGEEVDEQLIDAFGLVVVDPVRRVGQALDAVEAGHIVTVGLAHSGAEVAIALAPD